MEPHELARFLGMVRRKSFVDYLDPIGETALLALERRLRWSEISQRDPAHVDEAAFLLRHAVSLRDLVRTMPEAEEDDWTEEDDPAPGPKSKLNLMHILDNDDDESEEEAATIVQPASGIMKIEDITASPAPRRSVAPVLAVAPKPMSAPPVFQDPWAMGELPSLSPEESGTAPSVEPRTHAGAAPRSGKLGRSSKTVFSDDDFGRTIVPDDLAGLFPDGGTIVPDEDLEELEVDQLSSQGTPPSAPVTVLASVAKRPSAPTPDSAKNRPAFLGGTPQAARRTRC